MKKVQVKVIKGTLGHWDGKKVVPKTSKDKAFLMDAVRASELAERGIVEVVSEESASEEEKTLADMTMDELKAVADTYSIEYKSSIRKAELIALIEEAEQGGEQDTGEEDDETDSGEQPPAFNPADAVQ